MKRTIPILCVGLFLSQGARGETTAPWLDLPNGAKQAAFSGAFGALAGDVEALGVNPAALAEMDADEIDALHNQWAQNLTMEHLSYGHGFGGAGLALGVDYLNFGQVPLYDLSPLGIPVANGSFSPMGMVFTGGGGLEVLPDLSLGAEGKILFQSLVSGITSSGFAGDFGALFRNRSSGISVGLSLLNLGTSFEGADLPLELHLSGGYQVPFAIGQEFFLGLDGGWGIQDPNGSQLRAGMEYLYQGVLALRTGYRLASYGSLQGLPGFSAGVGVYLGPAELSYAMTGLGDLGLGHQVSLAYHFGASEEKPLSAPTGLVTGWDDGKMILSWNQVRETGLAGYNFYLRKTKDSDFKKMNTTPLQDNTVILEHVKNGISFQFGITAVDRAGRESAMSQLTFKP